MRSLFIYEGKNVGGFFSFPLICFREHTLESFALNFARFKTFIVEHKEATRVVLDHHHHHHQKPWLLLSVCVF